MFPTFFSDDESTDVTMDDVVDDPAVDDSLDLPDVAEDLLEQTLLLLPSLMLEDKGCGGSQRLFGLLAIEVWSVKVNEGDWYVVE
jgi:hypothetical protein